MAKKQKTIPAPFKLVHKIVDAYLGAWEIVEDFREQRDLSVPDWDEICYIPISATLAIDKIIGSWIAAAAAWRIHKVIYRFDRDFADLLSDQGMEFKVPIDTSRQLPYPCIYIDCPLEDGVLGFFAHIDHDMTNDRYELRFLFSDGESADAFCCPFVSGADDL